MFGRLVEITAAAVILLEAAPAYAQSYRPFVVKTPDAVNISAQEWGNPNGKEIVFIHGFMQSHLSWTKQVRDPELARQFRMISTIFAGTAVPTRFWIRSSTTTEKRTRKS